MPSSSFWPNWRENPTASLFVALLGVAGAALLIAQTRNTIAEYDQIGRPDTVRDTITIDGEGKVSGAPDVAQFSVGYRSEGRDISTVQTENTRKVNAILAEMKKLGIPDKDLQTTNYSIQPEYDWNNGRQQFRAYVVNQTVTVKVRDFSKLDAAVGKIGQLDANQFYGLDFTLDDPAKMKQEARKKALEDARRKAEELADALGIRLGRVVTYSEGGGGYPVPMYYKAEARDMAVSAPAAAPMPEIQAGELDIRSNVSVTFEVK